MKFDLRQRISLIMALVAVAYFIGHTLHKARSEPSVAQKVAADPTTPTSTGNAVTSGDDSPAVTGNGNTFNYNDAKSPERNKKNNSAPAAKGNDD